MENDKSELTSDQVDALLKRAGSRHASVSDDLMGRILADAERERKIPSGAVDPAPLRSRWFWQELLAQIGGVPGMAGLAMAGVTGLFIGLGDFGLQDLTAQAFGLQIADYDISDLYAAYEPGDS